MVLRGLSPAVRLVAALCVALPLALQAEGPILTLAMVKPGDLLKRQFQTVKERLGVGLSRAAQSQPATSAAEVPALSLTANLVLSLTVPLQKRADAEPGSSVMLTRTNLRELGRSKMWASIEAGYGQFFSDKEPTIYGHNGSRWEEPSCGYLKLSFSF